MSQTVKLHRVLNSTPEKIYKAFLDSDALAKWLPPNGFFGKVHYSDFSVGGKVKMTFSNIGSGESHDFFRTYQELIINEKIVHSDTFDESNMENQMLTTIDIKKVSCGTELIIIQNNIPKEIPLDSCYLGWQESLNLLKLLVEANI